MPRAVGKCFEALNTDFGAPAPDPSFLQDCINAVSCGVRKQCAFDPNRQAAGCYCGSISLDACSVNGPAPDAPCLTEWQAAARSTDHALVEMRFADLAYPSGWAFFLLDCTRERCGSSCVAPTTCGNGSIEGSEQCDDGNTAGGDGCEPNCTRTPVCGNGVIDLGEQCDDGNQFPADGCEPNCTRTPVCGNSVVEVGEQCDDGNQVPRDGCEPNCTRTPAVCGDGVRQGTEQCDDGNTVSGDGCEADCSLPRPTSCPRCMEQRCRDFLGVDLYAGCFESINPDFGAPIPDPSFIQDCVDAVGCAVSNECAFNPQLGPAACYCGSASGDLCSIQGPAADAPCVSAWQKATRSTNNNDVQIRFADLAFPSGWAYFLLDCARTECSEVCRTPGGR